MFTLCLPVPVLVPVISQVCELSGKREVSCTSKGPNLTFTWKLNNKPLLSTPADNESPPAEHVSRPVTATITVEANQSGNLACEVRNEVSSGEASVHLRDCHAAEFQFPYVAAIIATASLLFLFALLVCFILLFKKSNSQDVNGGDSDAGGVVYADVKIHMGMKREMKHSAETVEYGQIRVHHQPNE
ncbi:uncharacterized protein LOC108890253 isoform X2 [Lates calcarifer]|uniref:Uncharacterized protein LOC108890253 isoform X2 n=1 Tax=Lates calcarifer TaxID=8187 RepID=A0AAJ8B178_LATCA|nr:uncharacterized protein LOC108890253 isoform X2 [Lates calcarifer]